MSCRLGKSNNNNDMFVQPSEKGGEKRNYQSGRRNGKKKNYATHNEMKCESIRFCVSGKRTISAHDRSKDADKVIQFGGEVFLLFLLISFMLIL